MLIWFPQRSLGLSLTWALREKKDIINGNFHGNNDDQPVDLGFLPSSNRPQVFVPSGKLT